MREFKFRAWDKEDKRMIIDEQDFIPLLVTNKGVMRLSHKHEDDLWEVMPLERFEFMQYTGLTDVNGREIYEGDVVKGKYWTDGKEHRFIGQVKFLAPSFQVVGINQYYGMNQELHRLYEVIGNIYEHSHLLEGN